MLETIERAFKDMTKEQALPEEKKGKKRNFFKRRPTPEQIDALKNRLVPLTTDAGGCSAEN